MNSWVDFPIAVPYEFPLNLPFLVSPGFLQLAVVAPEGELTRGPENFSLVVHRDTILFANPIAHGTSTLLAFILVPGLFDRLVEREAGKIKGKEGLLFFGEWLLCCDFMV